MFSSKGKSIQPAVSSSGSAIISTSPSNKINTRKSQQLASYLFFQVVPSQFCVARKWMMDFIS
jgi:hypothetical protein